MTTISALPDAPNPLTDSQASYNSKALAFTQALPTLVTEINTVAGEVNTAKTAAETAETNAETAETNAALSEANAAASATAAGNSAAAAAWAAGTYALNDCAVSQVNFITYRKITASSMTTIDPASDPANWRATNGDLTAVAVTSTGTCIDHTLEKCAATAAITRTIPSGLPVGARIAWLDDGQGFATYSLTVAPPSGHAIEDLATNETLEITTSHLGFELRQTSAGQWRIL